PRTKGHLDSSPPPPRPPPRPRPRRRLPRRLLFRQNTTILNPSRRSNTSASVRPPFPTVNIHTCPHPLPQWPLSRRHRSWRRSQSSLATCYVGVYLIQA